MDRFFLRGGRSPSRRSPGPSAIVNIGTVVQANLTGFSLVLVAAVETQYDQIVFARPGIAKLEQLKGKKFGISGFGSATHYATLILLKHLNIDPKDLALLPSGPDAERLAALIAGRIDATLFTSSAAAPARKSGFVELLQIGDLGVEVQGNGFATSRDYVKTNRDVVKNALRGFVEAIYSFNANERGPRRSSPNTGAPTSGRARSSSTATSNRSRKNLTRRSKESNSARHAGRKIAASKNAKPEQFVDFELSPGAGEGELLCEMAKR